MTNVTVSPSSISSLTISPDSSLTSQDTSDDSQLALLADSILFSLEKTEATNQRIEGLLHRQNKSYSSNSIDLSHWNNQLERKSDLANWALLMAFQYNKDPSIASNAMFLFDKFLSLEPPKFNSQKDVDKYIYKTLFTAINVSFKTRGTEQDSLDFKLLADSSRGRVNEQEVQNHEGVFLDALQWKVNPTTPEDFIHEFVSLLNLDKRMENIIEVLAGDLSRCATLDNNKLLRKSNTDDEPGVRNFEASDLALASIWGALELEKVSSSLKKIPLRT